MKGVFLQRGKNVNDNKEYLTFCIRKRPKSCCCKKINYENGAYKYEIVFAKLLDQTKQLNDVLETSQKAVVKERTNIRIPYNHVYIKHYSFLTGLST